MLITINNKFFTDNSHEANDKVSFVYSKDTKQYIQNAKENGCVECIQSSSLKDLVDFSSISIVGITGTNGKTTTAAAIYSILLDLGYKVALQGTRGFFINDERIEEYSLTTPVQLSNFEHILKAQEEGCQFFVMEVSSHAIVQNRIEGLKFALKILTNIIIIRLKSILLLKTHFFKMIRLNLLTKMIKRQNTISKMVLPTL